MGGKIKVFIIKSVDKKAFEWQNGVVHAILLTGFNLCVKKLEIS